MKSQTQKLVLFVGILALTVGCTASTESNNTQQTSNATTAANFDSVTTITIDGSSTVYPITQAIAKEFQSNPQNQTKIEVAISGTGGGFEKFCTGKTDISNASRPISQAEMALCSQNNIRYIELPVAFDALTITVNPANNWAKDITVEELKKIWEPAAAGKITRWNQIRPSWPNRPLKLYGPGEKSGTFDYFTEAITGKAKASRKDYTASEDDDVLAAGIIKDPDALGYFGFAYYEKNKDKLKALPVNNGKQTVFPSRETVEKSTYQPLSRPLFIYVNIWSKTKQRSLYQFGDFYLEKAPKISSNVGYVPLPEEAYKIGNVHLHQGKVGTVFGGKSEFDLTIRQLLRKQKQL